MILKRIFIAAALILSFSAELFSQTDVELQLKKHVYALAADSLMGRYSGHKGEEIAYNYITRVLKESDITTLYNRTGQDFSFVSDKGDTLYSKNVVAIIEGYDPVLKNEYVLIGAHYDHLGYNKMQINGKESLQIYKGADDNASGVSILMEVAKDIKRESFNFRRSVIIAAFGAEEQGLVGSWYFTNRAFSYAENINLMINLDMVGKSGGENYPRVYTVLPGVELSTMLKDVSDLPAMISPKIIATDYFASDHQNFSKKGIPVALLTTGIHRDYHTPRDLPESLDYKSMASISRYVFELAKSAANQTRSLPRTAFAEDKQVPSSAGKDSSGRVYSTYDVDQAPSFLRGDQRQFLDKWVYDYIKYPQSAMNSGIQGRVIVEFIVEKSGEVSSVEVVKSVDDALDAEAVKVVKASPRWKPGIKGGVPVRVKISVPIEFKLKR
ncbi:MAG: TonB family protein [Bacteroidales bacterium]|jgi:TonB family protein